VGSVYGWRYSAGAARGGEAVNEMITETVWICENPDCKKVYPEYVNGCVECYEGRIAQGKPPLHFSVRAVIREKE
jgi:hypothetical protein